MKGVSPLVATILLIAFAVGVAGLFSIWITGYAGETTEFTEQKSEDLTACTGVRIFTESVTATSILYSNPSTKIVTNITVFDGSGRNLTSVGSTLNPGQVGNVTWTRGTNTSVFMTGVCEKTVIVRGQCKDGQGCWE